MVVQEDTYQCRVSLQFSTTVNIVGAKGFARTRNVASDGWLSRTITAVTPAQIQLWLSPCRGGWQVLDHAGKDKGHDCKNESREPSNGHCFVLAVVIVVDGKDGIQVARREKNVTCSVLAAGLVRCVCCVFGLVFLFSLKQD